VEAGDTLELLSKHPDGLSVADVTSLYTTERENIALLKKAISVTALPESWTEYFEQQLGRLED
jgi:MOSC domain-containing protein YiiM